MMDSLNEAILLVTVNPVHHLEVSITRDGDESEDANGGSRR